MIMKYFSRGSMIFHKLTCLILASRSYMDVRSKKTIYRFNNNFGTWYTLCVTLFNFPETKTNVFLYQLYTVSLIFILVMFCIITIMNLKKCTAFTFFCFFSFCKQYNVFFTQITLLHLIFFLI